MSGMHALLIGIDQYLPNQLPDGSRYDSLSGSVRDIERVEAFLRQELPQPPQRILKLTASRGADGPPEPRERWPTYENMVAAFREIARDAAPGDQIYIHYSGHGGRTTTLFPEIRGRNGYDEGLVPCDIGDPGSRYLRGPEVAFLIREMVERQLAVTVVFDCCHSAGIRRGIKGAVKRGLEVVDPLRRPTDSLVASREELLGSYRRQAAQAPAPVSVKRSVVMETTLGNPQGFVFLAACRPQDCAYEYPFEGSESQGALTYYLLKALREEGVGLSFRELEARVFAQVYNQFKYQTPMAVGEVDRPFYGGGPPPVRAPEREGALVLGFEEGRILLNVGQAHGVKKGMRFTIHRPEAEPVPGDRGQAEVEIEDLGATESWGRIVRTTRSLIRPGARAVPLSPPPSQAKQQGAVRINGVPAHVLPGLQRVLGTGDGFLRLAGEEETADFQVTANSRGEYELLDGAGLPIPHLRPAVRLDQPGADEELWRRLDHLTRFRNVRRIKNADADSPLAGTIGIKVLGTQKDFMPGDEPDPRPPVVADAGAVEMEVGEWLFLEIGNLSSRVLNVAILDLQPDWGISQIFPKPNDAPFWPLDPGETRLVRIRGSLPDGYDEGTDVIKVFATMGASSYRWMLLPALDRPEARRNLSISAWASEEWTTEQLEVRLRR